MRLKQSVTQKNTAILRINGEFFNINITNLTQKVFENVKVVAEINQDKNKTIAIYSKGKLLGKLEQTIGMGQAVKNGTISSEIIIDDLIALSDAFFEKYNEIIPPNKELITIPHSE